MLFVYLRKERDGRPEERINTAGDKKNEYISCYVFAAVTKYFG